MPARAVVAFAGLLLVVGCSSDGGKDAKGTAPGAAVSGGGSGSGGDQGSAKGGSGGGPLTAPADANDEQKKQYVETNALADCMKKAGFNYVPYVQVTPIQDRDDNDRDYTAARKIREKYGFGAFSSDVYPDDPNAPGVQSPAISHDPNDATFRALPQDRKDAWNTALYGSADGAKMKQSVVDGKGCYGEARTKAYGDKAKIEADSKTKDEQGRINRQNLNGDAELVRFAQAYATCMRGKGYPLRTTAVIEIRTAARFEWFEKAGTMRPRPAPGDPKPTSPAGLPHMDPAAARGMLAQEIQAALADLDCGKDFRAAYYPKADKAPGAEGAG
ncbi:hypothetical protein [Yinghuangia seranimata]|uniref:hypothetical protein n=1 Tax=Yinghuangia seranimata TaxID=408067 RepID=UPI00248B0F77|nr:hypothetical protein [Yinghuangia seranimata]MDI2132539.1 hypothetical protein [Yinghuangia seranimata]